ncbi:MAG: D-alanyl-D-alanine carboxypeptidase family protein [bacterium]
MIAFNFNFNFIYVNASDTPNIISQGAIVMDAQTGRVLFGKNIDEPLAMASTTKIMTAIITLENANLKDVVTVGKNPTTAPNVKMNLKQGEEILLENLLYALMLESANDSAIAIAEYVFGDVETFCEKMTEKALLLGAKDTIFKTPNGLDLDDHHSTAYDMAIITQYALQNPKFVEIINTSQVSFSTNKSSYSLTNKNGFLNIYDGANGVKTGYTNKAGFCFVGSASRDDMTLIAVVLTSGWGTTGKTNRWQDTKNLLDYGFDNFEYLNIINQGILVDEKGVEISVPVLKGEVDFINIYYQDDIVIPISEEEQNNGLINIVLDYQELLEAPTLKDQKIGTASVFISGELIASTDILTYQEVSKNTLANNIYNIFKNWVNIIK